MSSSSPLSSSSESSSTSSSSSLSTSPTTTSPSASLSKNVTSSDSAKTEYPNSRQFLFNGKPYPSYQEMVNAKREHNRDFLRHIGLLEVASGNSSEANDNNSTGSKSRISTSDEQNAQSKKKAMKTKTAKYKLNFDDESSLPSLRRSPRRHKSPPLAAPVSQQKQRRRPQANHPSDTDENERNSDASSITTVTSISTGATDSATRRPHSKNNSPKKCKDRHSSFTKIHNKYRESLFEMPDWARSTRLRDNRNRGNCATELLPISSVRDISSLLEHVIMNGYRASLRERMLHEWNWNENWESILGDGFGSFLDKDLKEIDVNLGLGESVDIKALVEAETKAVNSNAKGGTDTVENTERILSQQYKFSFFKRQPIVHVADWKVYHQPLREVDNNDDFATIRQSRINNNDTESDDNESVLIPEEFIICNDDNQNTNSNKIIDGDDVSRGSKNQVKLNQPSSDGEFNSTANKNKINHMTNYEPLPLSNTFPSTLSDRSVKYNNTLRTRQFDYIHNGPDRFWNQEYGDDVDPMTFVNDFCRIERNQADSSSYKDGNRHNTERDGATEYTSALLQRCWERAVHSVSSAVTVAPTNASCRGLMRNDDIEKKDRKEAVETNEKKKGSRKRAREEKVAERAPSKINSFEGGAKINSFNICNTSVGMTCTESSNKPSTSPTKMRKLDNLDVMTSCSQHFSPAIHDNSSFETTAGKPNIASKETTDLRGLIDSVLHNEAMNIVDSILDILMVEHMEDDSTTKNSGSNSKQAEMPRQFGWQNVLKSLQAVVQLQNKHLQQRAEYKSQRRQPKNNGSGPTLKVNQTRCPIPLNEASLKTLSMRLMEHYSKMSHKVPP